MEMRQVAKININLRYFLVDSMAVQVYNITIKENFS